MENSTLELKLQKLEDSFKEILAANNPKNLQPEMVAFTKIEAYNGKSALKELASIGKIDSNTLEIKPFDKELIKNIEKELWNLQKGTIINNRTTLLFKLPDLTTDMVEILVKKTKVLLEDCRTKVKKIRQDHIDDFKKIETNKDKIKKETDRIQKFIDNTNLNLQTIFKDWSTKILN